ncbi:restriction endonuclease subunit S [Leuconostoc palmae]|uniref:restriction endonuclease subunit S n=1 Tax=Leuconostoc palmae TaxID=501487 RepID=UPI001C7E1A0A|nr:restriction endonuclease subunit S [Leuconostoc palmae]
MKQIFNKIGRGNISRQKDLVPSKNGVNLIVQKNVDNGYSGNFELGENRIFKAQSIIIGRQTGWVYYQPETFMTTDGVLVLESDFQITDSQGLYLASAINKKMGPFGYNNPVSVAKLKKLDIDLPFSSNGMIAFDYMEAYIKELEAERIKELEAYLVATGLDDYVLNAEEEKVLADFRNNNIEFRDFAYKDLFDHIVQGRRLKKDDQIAGNLPFVMSGTTNSGIVGNIGNDTRIFPKNSLTIDIFGSVFYRNYIYGMGDDTGAYWNEKNELSKFTMLYFGTAIGKALAGKYDYGHKLRSSKTLNFTIKLPVKSDKQPDYEFINHYICSIEKLVIKGVVEWKDKQIKATKDIVQKDK